MKKLWQERKRVKAMKKIVALLTAVMILAGSVGMVASAAVDPDVCKHTDVKAVADYTYSTTSTHPVWVANKPNGEPILATCTYTVIWQHYSHICNICKDVRGTHSEKISEQHSMTH